MEKKDYGIMVLVFILGGLVTYSVGQVVLPPQAQAPVNLGNIIVDARNTDPKFQVTSINVNPNGIVDIDSNTLVYETTWIINGKPITVGLDIEFSDYVIDGNNIIPSKAEEARLRGRLQARINEGLAELEDPSQFEIIQRTLDTQVEVEVR